MFDRNRFKKSVKIWMVKNQGASVNELKQYCQTLIPKEHIRQEKWLIEQTTQWYKHILSMKNKEHSSADYFVS